MALKLTELKFNLKTLIVAAVIFFTLTAITAYMNNREDLSKASYVGQSSQLSMLSQRLAKDAQQALAGNAAAFDAVSKSKGDMQEILNRLDKGDITLPPTKADDARAALSRPDRRPSRP